MIKIINNSLGSCDWVRVVGADGELLLDAHSIAPFDLVMILQNLGHQAEMVEVDDEQMEAV